MKKPIDSYVKWHEDDKVHPFMRYTIFRDKIDVIMGEPITEAEYLKEKGW